MTIKLHLASATPVTAASKAISVRMKKLTDEVGRRNAVAKTLTNDLAECKKLLPKVKAIAITVEDALKDLGVEPGNGLAGDFIWGAEDLDAKELTSKAKDILTPLGFKKTGEYYIHLALYLHASVQQKSNGSILKMSFLPPVLLKTQI